MVAGIYYISAKLKALPCEEGIGSCNHVYILQVTIDLPEGFTPTCMAHPDTYLNKVVVGSQEGKLQLWNFLSGKMLYDFSGLGEGAVKCIISSPALDVVGVGLSGGCASATSI